MNNNNHGGARPGAGRKAGGKNKDTKEVRELKLTIRATDEERKELKEKLKKVKGKASIEKILKGLDLLAAIQSVEKK